MSHKLTEADGRRALHDHLCEKAAAARSRYGPDVDADAIVRMLSDAEVVRYPTRLRFEAFGLLAGEFAHAMQIGEHPSDGFELLVHPAFESRRDLWPLLIAYHIPPINYGEIASSDECEAFGAALLGLDVESYYCSLCDLADALPNQARGDGSCS